MFRSPSRRHVGKVVIWSQRSYGVKLRLRYSSSAVTRKKVMEAAVAGWFMLCNLLWFFWPDFWCRMHRLRDGVLRKTVSFGQHLYVVCINQDRFLELQNPMWSWNVSKYVHTAPAQRPGKRTFTECSACHPKPPRHKLKTRFTNCPSLTIRTSTKGVKNPMRNSKRSVRLTTCLEIKRQGSNTIENLSLKASYARSTLTLISHLHHLGKIPDKFTILTNGRKHTTQTNSIEINEQE